jgi:hypothetical protein
MYPLYNNNMIIKIISKKEKRNSLPHTDEEEDEHGKGLEEAGKSGLGSITLKEALGFELSGTCPRVMKLVRDPTGVSFFVCKTMTLALTLLYFNVTDGTGDHPVKQTKPGSEELRSHALPPMWEHT